MASAALVVSPDFTVTSTISASATAAGSLLNRISSGSSLACPDWPTCYGTMVPEMTGGVFWEHLHRLVAGGLLLMWGLGTWLARREPSARPWFFRAALAGVGLLLVQSIFGGLTVIYRLPDHLEQLQDFIWQQYDMFPQFPELRKFLSFWEQRIEGPLHSITVAHARLIRPVELHALRGARLN